MRRRTLNTVIVSLIGTLEDIKLADVLRLFSAGRKSGLLTVARPGVQALLRLQRGSIVHASTGSLNGDEAVLDLFGWKQGQLTFVPEERAVAGNVTRQVDALILEGLRVGEALHRKHELIPTDRVTFQMGPGPQGEDARSTLGRREWQLLRLLDGVRDVQELAEETGLARSDVAQALFEMAEAGLVERVDTARSLRLAPQGSTALEEALLDARLQEDWLKVVRFARGVYRVEVRSAAGRAVSLPASFRPGLQREIHLPRGIVAELGVQEGGEVTARPVG